MTSDDKDNHMSVALITGGSAGLGLALARALDEQGWTVVTDARDADRAAAGLDGTDACHGVAGDVADADHRAALVDRGRPSSAGSTCWCYNASTLGPLPMRPLRELRAARARRDLPRSTPSHRTR